MNEMSIEVQALGWKIAIVRAVHRTKADAWSIDDLIEEFDRMQRTIVTVKDENGQMSAITELKLRLDHGRVR